MTTSAWLHSFILFLAAAVAGDPAKEKSGETGSLPAQQPEIADSAVYSWVFGDSFDAVVVRRQLVRDAVEARKQLDAQVRQKIAVVDQVCGLTDGQKQELERAGEDDNSRLIDRVEELGRQFRLDKGNQDKVRVLVQRAQMLRYGLGPGEFDEGSLFGTSLQKTLTAEQHAKYEPLRDVLQKGGRAQMLEHGPVKGLILSLTGPSIADDDLSHVGDLPGLRILILQNTQVTDDGFVYLRDLTGLKVLALCKTQATGAGIAELKRALPGLKVIY
jgi:hypothetical protein